MLYDGLGLRPFADLDFMIRRPDLPAARNVMQSRGYEPTVQIAPALEPDFVRTQYEYGMLQAASGVYVELQWAAAPRFYSVHFDEERFWANAQALQLGGVTLLTPSPADLPLLLSVHAAKHAWGRLIWLVDISELIRRYPGLDWSQVLQTARTTGILDMVLITLLLAQRLVGAQLPAVVAATVSENPRITVLADRVQQAVATGSAEFVSPSPAHFWLMFRVRERWSDRARFVARLALTPTHEEWNAVRLPRWLFPLYRVIRVVRALRHLPAVCGLAWRRA